MGYLITFGLGFDLGGFIVSALTDKESNQFFGKEDTKKI